MTDDAQFLRRYAEEGSEAAFTALVERHVSLVYGAALRRVGGDAHLAKDVAQQVFTALAREAKPLSRRTTLAGWLYTTTRNAAAHAVRTERRRRAREQEAEKMKDHSSDFAANADWEQVRPLLDAALDALNAREREAVLLRFVQGRTFGEVAVALQTTEDAARMRVGRALDKLRDSLGRRGVTSTAGALGAMLAEQAAAAAPSGMAAALSHTAVAASATGASAFAGGWAAIFTMGKVQNGAIVALMLASVGAFVAETRATRGLEQQVAEARSRFVDLTPLQAENQRLKFAMFELSSSEDDLAELERLRKRAAELRGKLPGPGPRRGVSREEASLRERTTPYLAYQGMVRAIFADDFERLGWLLCFDDDARVKLDAFFQRLPAAARLKHGTPEGLVARVFVQWRWQGDPPRSSGGGVKQIPVGNDAVVELPLAYWSGREDTERFEFKRFEDGWRFGPITSGELDAILALLDPATGEPREQPNTAFYSRRR